MNNAYNMKILPNWSFWRYWIHKTYFLKHFQRLILLEEFFFWKYLAFYDKYIVKYLVKYGYQMSLLTCYNEPVTAWKPVTGPLFWQARAGLFWRACYWPVITGP